MHKLSQNKKNILVNLKACTMTQLKLKNIISVKQFLVAIVQH